MMDQLKDGPKQQARANRILDAAAELVLRWGYDKTTVDDISRKAAVAKGTIYLHWKTREALFAALLQRETAGLATDYRRQLENDPAGVTLSGIYTHAALALLRRPLLKAFLLQDREVIGRMAHMEENSEAYRQRLAGFSVYLRFLQQHGLVRADLSDAAQIHTVTAIFVGFFTVAPLMPEPLRIPDEEMAALIGESIHRTLESGRVLSPEETRQLSASFLAYLDQIMASPVQPPTRA